MLTMICALAIGIALYTVLSNCSGLSPVWNVTFSLIAMFLFQLAVMFVLRRVSANINRKLQALMMETQQKLQVMQNQFMRRPVGNQKTMMQMMEREQNAGLQRMIDALDLYKPLNLWNFMMKKQVNCMRMLFLFQMKKFQEADALMKDCVYFDAQSICVRMTRMYQNKEEDIDKFFHKKIRRLKGNDLVLPYALYSWILVKQEKVDEAIKLLSQAKAKTSNEVLIHNWEMLVNGKPKHFSNAQLGEPWYALYLEEPKMPKMRQQVQYRR